MRTEELIARLAGGVEPVRPLPPPWVRSVMWSGVAVLSAAAGIALFGVRSNIGTALYDPQFAWITAVVLATAASAVTAALVLAIPGMEWSPVLRVSALLLAGCWAAMLAGAVVQTGHGFAGVSDWYVCFLRITGMALVPVAVLFGMLRRAAPLQPAWAGALSAIAAAAAGAFAIQFICPLVDPGHALLGHFGPVLVLAALGAAAARSLLERFQLL